MKFRVPNANIRGHDARSFVSTIRIFGDMIRVASCPLIFKTTPLLVFMRRQGLTDFLLPC
jgi:hypothetical protein